MATAVTLNDAAQEIAASYARSKDLSLSEATSELVLRALEARPRIKYVDGYAVFDVPPGEMIPNERAKQIEANEY